MKRFIIFILDIIFLYLSLFFISYIHWGSLTWWHSSTIVYKNVYYIIAFNLSILYFTGLYNNRRISSKSFVIIRALLSQLFTVVSLGFLVFFFRIEDTISRFLMFYYFALTVMLLFLARYCTYKLSFIFGKKEDIVLIGSPKSIKKILYASKFFKYHNFNILGYLSTIDTKKTDIMIKGNKILYLGTLSNLSKAGSLIKKTVKLIICEHELSEDQTNLIEELMLNNYNIDVTPDFYEFAYGKAYMDFSFNLPLVKFGLSQKEFYFFLKRIFDILVSFVLLIITLPIMLITAILIPLESKGSPFYLQERIGRFGKPFKIIKFRSMYKDTDKIKKAPSDGADDTRITNLGKFLRKTRIDELPQLICVIWGSMSLIGPRPEWSALTPAFDNIKFYHLRHLVRPGITGWAQVNFRYTASVDDTAEKLKYDLFYVKNMSIELDVEILFKTIAVVLGRKGI